MKNQLLQTLAKCDQPKCRALQEKYKIGQLDTEIQYSQVLIVTCSQNSLCHIDGRVPTESELIRVIVIYNMLTFHADLDRCWTSISPP